MKARYELADSILKRKWFGKIPNHFGVGIAILKAIEWRPDEKRILAKKIAGPVSEKRRTIDRLSPVVLKPAT
ncbi:MAG: hypothetical protein KDC43_23305 [Saprospiraceae bacterium]|nr:hypothetical protein [Saprospiraceae bacterium]